MTTQVNVAALDGGGRATTIRGDLNPDNSIALRSSLEIGGAAVGPSNQIPTADAAAGLALGAPADAAWGGSGAGSIIAALKAIWAKLAGTLTTTLTGALPAGANALGTIGRTPFAFIGAQSGTCNAAAGTVSAAPIVPFSATRKVLHLFNRSNGSETMDVGPANTVTVGGGIPVPAGGGFTFDGQGASGPFYAISPVASTPFSYVEG